MSAKTVVGIVYGGRSGEHEISLLSAAAIIRNIDKSKFGIVAVGISHEGVWYLQPQNVVDDCLAGKALALDESQPVSLAPGGKEAVLVAGGKVAGSASKAAGASKSAGSASKVAAVPADGASRTAGSTGGSGVSVDIFFPVLHGTYGEDGSIQGLFEMLRVPYVGNGVFSSSLGMDKIKIKQIWEQAGLPVVPYTTFQYTGPSDLPHSARAEDLWRVWTEKLGAPLFIKPARAGSSVGISKVAAAADLETALRDALQYDSKLLVEKALRPREIEVAVLGNLHPRAFPPGEVRSTHDFYSYEAKYQDPNGAALLVPAPISEEVATVVQDLAIKAFRAAEMRGLARVDFFLSEDDDEIYLNEINTMPGFTQISMYPRMCEAAGLPFPALIDELISSGIEEFQRKEGLRYYYH